jgi:hypothetical protein
MARAEHAPLIGLADGRLQQVFLVTCDVTNPNVGEADLSGDWERRLEERDEALAREAAILDAEVLDDGDGNATG